MRVLILGGSSEASALARLIAAEPGIEATLSLAGRTAEPASAPIACRSGGFGGIDGLIAYLARERIEAVVDATHPFAAQMSRHAHEACTRMRLPLLVLTRPAWEVQEGDRWTEVADAEAAALALGTEPRNVFLTVGRLSLPAFAAAPQHRYLVRAIDAPQQLAGLPHHTLILARPPFGLAGEIATLRAHAIEVLVSKNSGGQATYAKIAAARALGLKVVMIHRPKASDAQTLYDPRAALAWLAAHRNSS